MTVYAYSQDQIAKGAHLESDIVSNPTLAAAGTQNIDVEVAGVARLTILGDLTGAAIGDLAITVQPYFGDNVTLEAVVLSPMYTPPANVVAGGHVSSYAEYDVTGLGRVRILAKNNNVGAQALKVSWRTQTS